MRSGIADVRQAVRRRQPDVRVGVAEPGDEGGELAFGRFPGSPRCAVLAGEELGHLPGTEAQKLEPLLAPLLDSVTKIMGAGAWAALKNKNLLELQSFAYMRGRTHDDAFVVAGLLTFRGAHLPDAFVDTNPRHPQQTTNEYA